MNKSVLERNLVVVLFVMVLMVFSMAQRDTKKIERLYTATAILRENGVSALLSGPPPTDMRDPLK